MLRKKNSRKRGYEFGEVFLSFDRMVSEVFFERVVLSKEMKEVREFFVR